jgi:IS5 family transposase
VTVRVRHRQLLLAQVVLFGVVHDLESLVDPMLRRVDELLDDEALVETMLAALKRRRPNSATRGRKGTPAEVVLRMLVLRKVRNWTFEAVEREVRGNIGYRHFCRIGAESVPDATTLVRLEKALEGPELRALFDRVVAIAIERGITSGRKMRIDTTVVEAPIRHPTDSRLLEDSIRVLSRHVRRIASAGVRLLHPIRSTIRSVSRRAREIAQIAKQRGDEVKEALQKPYRGLLRITGRWIRTAEHAIAQAHAASAKLQIHARRSVERSIAILEAMLPRAQSVVRQTRARILRGVANSAEKIISIFEPYAQILRRGKPHQPTEFGLLVRVMEAEHGIVTDICEVPGKADAPLLVPAVERHIALFGAAPRVAATDRGFFSFEAEEKLRGLGVCTVAVPKPGYKSKERIEHERNRSFRRGRAWRAGGEARIAHLKHDFGMKRSRSKGTTGIYRSIHWAAIASNIHAIARRGPP